MDVRKLFSDFGRSAMDWNDVRYFLAVARGGSLTGAAAQLHASQSTISRRIDMLEHRLGIRLFSRHQTGYLLTDEGAGLVTHAEALEAAALDLEGYSSGVSRGVIGTVRLATAENLASHLIIPARPKLRNEHPDVRLEIVTSVASVSLSRREADLALRLSRPEQGNITIRHLGDQAYAVYGSRDYLHLHGRVHALGRLEGHAFIGWDDSWSHLPMARWLNQATDGAVPAITSSSLQGHLAAAKAGIGLALLPCFLADPETELERVCEPAETFTQEIWLATHRHIAGSARVRAVASFLTDIIRSNRQLLLGTS
jgi:DNA-binding transcriptional LysR family regulator